MYPFSSSSSSSFLHFFLVKAALPSSKNGQNSFQSHNQHYTFPSQNIIKNTKLHTSMLQLQHSPPPSSSITCSRRTPGMESPLMDREEAPLKIAIIGFGKFGQFMAQGLKRQGHAVMAASRSDYTEYCKKQGILFFWSMEGMCEEKPDILLICSSILSTENVVRRIPFHKLKPDTIFVDVLSVKQFPRNLFLAVLPPQFGIVCTHPMFGPESGKDGWTGLPFVYDRVRLTAIQALNCDRFLSIFEHEGCRMVEMSCEEHDRYAAGSQFITHTIGRILSQLKLESTPINTKGYETLLKLTENTVSDSFDLYYGLFMYNVNATEQIENLHRAFDAVKQKLFGRLHDILRKQILERVLLPMEAKGEGRRMRSSDPAHTLLPRPEDIAYLSSFASAEEVPSSPNAQAPGGR